MKTVPWWVPLALVILALLLRLAIFPHSDETGNIDEGGYLKGSLAILEGEPAGYKAAPAGPNLWLGWLYLGSETAWHVVHPGPEERAVPMQVRPFVALDHVLFDNYHDLRRLHYLWIVSQIVLSLLVVLAGYRIGVARGGLAGGLFLGGFLAVLPLMVEFTDMSRPYMTAWSFGILALSSAVLSRSRWRVGSTGVLLGLAVASRIEMLLFVPVVMWEFWHRPETRPLWRVWTRLFFVVVVTALVAAPWLITHLVGNLRTIATVRTGPNPFGTTTLKGVLLQLSWNEALGTAMLAAVAVFLALLLPKSRWINAGSTVRWTGRFRLICLGLYVVALGATLAHGTIYLHQQGSVFLSLLVFALFAAAALNEYFPRAAHWVVIAILLLPLAQTVRRVIDIRRRYFPDPSAAWINAHVPAGTRVYTQYGLQDPLPTVAASKRLWDEVSDDAAWRAKFQSGLQRFGLTADELPRALSEENLVQERGNRRGMFIMGGRPAYPENRYEIELYASSPIFGVQLDQLPSKFKQTGGIVVWRGLPATELGTPVASWTNTAGEGTFIYSRPPGQ